MLAVFTTLAVARDAEIEGRIAVAQGLRAEVDIDFEYVESLGKRVRDALTPYFTDAAIQRRYPRGGTGAVNLATFDSILREYYQVDDLSNRSLRDHPMIAALHRDLDGGRSNTLYMNPTTYTRLEQQSRERGEAADAMRERLGITILTDVNAPPGRAYLFGSDVPKGVGVMDFAHDIDEAP